MDRVFIIAEAGVNHNGKIELAYKLIDTAVSAGADAIKFQTYISDQVVSKYAKRADYQKENMPKKKETQLEMLKRYELKLKDFKKLQEYCNKVGIEFITTPFDFKSADFINNLINIYKISSGEITNTPFLEHIARKNKPIILSTGMSYLCEVETAINIILKNQHYLKNINFPPLTVLHCTTNYPCSYEDVNLRAMLTLKKAFQLPVGYSDHTLGIEVPIAAVTLGAEIIEKHFTLDNNMEGPDHKASLEPKDLKDMVTAIRNIEKALGDGIKKPSSSELKNRLIVRKSIVPSRSIKKGEIFSESNITMKRPGTGISPKRWNEVIGKKAKRDFNEDELIEI